jgi:hypothetical protein
VNLQAARYYDVHAYHRRPGFQITAPSGNRPRKSDGLSQHKGRYVRDAVYADHDAWRKGYWETFGESALYKTPEWAHEEEYRIVAHSGFDMSDPIRRKLKYRFEDLAGIVFGARTDIEDKLKIMRIIDAKCAKARRSDFRFFEVRYLHTESRFQLFSLDLLKIQYS